VALAEIAGRWPRPGSTSRPDDRPHDPNPDLQAMAAAEVAAALVRAEITSSASRSVTATCIARRRTTATWSVMVVDRPHLRFLYVRKKTEDRQKTSQPGDTACRILRIERPRSMPNQRSASLVYEPQDQIDDRLLVSNTGEDINTTAQHPQFGRFGRWSADGRARSRA